jgi:hypothetical protein
MQWWNSVCLSGTTSILGDEIMPRLYISFVALALVVVAGILFFVYSSEWIDDQSPVFSTEIDATEDSDYLFREMYSFQKDFTRDYGLVSATVCTPFEMSVLTNDDRSFTYFYNNVPSLGIHFMPFAFFAATGQRGILIPDAFPISKRTFRHNLSKWGVKGTSVDCFTTQTDITCLPGARFPSFLFNAYQRDWAIGSYPQSTLYEDVNEMYGTRVEQPRAEVCMYFANTGELLREEVNWIRPDGSLRRSHVMDFLYDIKGAPTERIAGENNHVPSRVLMKIWPYSDTLDKLQYEFPDKPGEAGITYEYFINYYNGEFIAKRHQGGWFVDRCVVHEYPEERIFAGPTADIIRSYAVKEVGIKFTYSPSPESELHSADKEGTLTRMMKNY